jgi:hypothetical protein
VIRTARRGARGIRLIAGDVRRGVGAARGGAAPVPRGRERATGWIDGYSLIIHRFGVFNTNHADRSPHSTELSLPHGTSRQTKCGSPHCEPVKVDLKTMREKCSVKTVIGFAALLAFDVAKAAGPYSELPVAMKSF